MITEEQRDKLENLMRQLVVLREDLHQIEKTFSRLQNETIELYKKINGALDADK